MKRIAFGCLAFGGFIGSLLPISVLAASGTFTYVAGQVFVERNGQRIVAARGVEVDPGDLIVAGADGMAQLSMIDQAKLSLRSNSQLRIERYQRKAGDQDGAVLSLLRGTLRTFTGLLTASNRDKYQMKTRVATVGIRGSGNILAHEEEEGKPPVTINHTIEGSHIISSLTGNFAPIITLPNDTVKVEPGKPPERIPTPPSILNSSNTMIAKGEAGSTKQGAASEPAPAPAPSPTVNAAGSGSGSTGGSGNTTAPPPVVTPIIPPVVIASDPTGLRDIVLAGAGTTYSGQATAAQSTFEGTGLRAFNSVAGGAGTSATITGGTIAEARTFDIGNNSSITLGRWNSPSNLLLTGLGSFNGPAATTHFAYGSSGYPPYLSDVLTGTVSYQRIGATSPTNDGGVSGTLTTATLDVNFSARLLNAALGISMAASPNAPTYNIQATNVPFSLNSFFAITGYGLTITRIVNGQTSPGNVGIFGSLEGSFVGAALSGVILGYSFSDDNAATRQNVAGVVAFQAPSQNVNAPFVYGLISDPTISLAASNYSRTYATINRPDEVSINVAGAAQSFRGPFARGDGTIAGSTNYAIGTAQVVDSGFDATTGLSWGRWTGGSAIIGGVSTGLSNRSLHYIFASAQTGPTTLPLTGTAVYEVAGSTRPTDLGGNVGTMNTATLNANFSARTVDASLNVTIANQTWNASATGMAIYRDMTFGANTGRSPGGGLPAPTQLNITCSPSCGTSGFTGSLDGFFTGRTGQGAGVQYNLNGNITGAIAFRRRG
ncbi:MAG: FecR domain-containing protein [Burkholderiales bacterium]|nr:FecR domain-containing protein [Rhodocyclaceae bacterium]MCA3067694.1 FecR domain-containing protein [Rhodocyclaceae bacterium]